MKLHFIGIGGTFMAGLAIIAKQMGHEVSGTDHAVYPPMSGVLALHDIHYYEGYESHRFEENPDLIIVGNAMSRGNPLVEFILDKRWPFVSGPAWLSENVLRKKTVIAIAGTHGKTTTSALMAWILECAGLNPSFLIGGQTGNFKDSARLTSSPYFVIEADEYDTAFFDKRAKFVHYLPQYCAINNLEFDHADIYPSLQAIQTQFHHLIRTLPETGCLFAPTSVSAIDEVIAMGTWSHCVRMGLETDADYSCESLTSDFSKFKLVDKAQSLDTQISWALWGKHNMFNALTAFSIARRMGIDIDFIADAINRFIPPMRRMQNLAEVRGVRIFEDFAHHPTAIEETLRAFKQRFPENRLLCVFECRSNTMKRGDLAAALPKALNVADQIYFYMGETMQWNVHEILMELPNKLAVHLNTENLLAALCQDCCQGDIIVFMSNGSFAGIQAAFPAKLAAMSNQAIC